MRDEIKNVSKFFLKLTPVSLYVGNSTYWVVSSYITYDEIIPLDGREAITELALINSANHIIGSDSYSHHLLWGSTDTNDEAEPLLNLIMINNLDICNRCDDPGPWLSNCKELLDLILIWSDLSHLIRNWRVSKAHSFSDHRYLCLDINAHPQPQPAVTNYKKTVWSLYICTFSLSLPNELPTTKLKTKNLQ